MQLWLREFIGDPSSRVTIYLGLVMLVTLWAMAIISRRLRATQAQMDAMRSEMAVLNEALRAATDAISHQAKEHHPPKAQPQVHRTGELSDDELAAMPQVRSTLTP